MENLQLDSWKWAGILMLCGGVIFWIGAFYPPYKQWMTSDVKEYLTIIGSNKTNWYIIHGCFVLGIIISIFGIHLLSNALFFSTGSKILPPIGFTSFSFGSIFWILNIAFRLTVTVWAANTLIETGTLHETFKTWMDWTNLLFSIYMVLAYFSAGCFGLLLREVSWMPSWVSWFSIIFGFAGIIGYIIRIPIWAPPLMVHLPFMITGLMILIKLPKNG